MQAVKVFVSAIKVFQRRRLPVEAVRKEAVRVPIEAVKVL
jgi:hypothetical protein